MALIAGLRKVSRDVIRIRRALIVLQVAGHAGSAGQVVVVINMAIGAQARRYRVSSAEREPDRVVIKSCVQPRIRSMTIGARRGEGSRDVAGIIRRLEVGRMARVALCRHRLELAGRSALVAGIAIDRRMRSGQREAVVVLLHLRHRDLPSAHRVALLAVCPQLSPVYVGVTILAALSNIGEHRLGMALDASHRLMHAPQRISRLIVIEFRNSTDWLPRTRCMTVLARKGQTSMRTMRAARCLGKGTPRTS